MTTVSRVSQVSHSNVSGGGDWDHRLNRLLEDLQDSVIPPETRRNASEYREFRMTSSSQVNDDPVQTVDEKWVEYGSRNGHGGGGTLGLTSGSSGRSGGGLPSLTSGAHDSAYGSRYGAPEKSVAFSDESYSRNNYSSTTGNTTHSHPILGSEYGSSGIGSSAKSPPTHMEYLAPANSTTVLKSGPSSPSGYSVVSSTSPKVERKEFYAKASYTTLIKGTGEPGDIPDIADNKADRILEDLLPHDFAVPSSRQAPSNPPGLSSVSSSETRRTYVTESRTGRGETQPYSQYDPHPPSSAVAPIGQPLYSSTPVGKTTTYTRESINDRTRSVTPPPKSSEGLKTPPLVRKILQQSSTTGSNTSYSKTSSSYDPKVGSGRPPLSGSGPNEIGSPRGGGIPSYDEPPERHGARYYTSTTTTEHREREISPVKRFPSPQPARPGDFGEPPKRLDDLLASFEDSSTFESTTKYSGDGGGPHKSVPYGPGTHQIQPTTRTVRIDENVQQRRILDDDPEIVQRKNTTSYQNPAYSSGGAPSSKEVEHTRNISGPPVFYPPGQIFSKTEEESLMQSSEGGKGKGKMKAERKYKEKEKMKSKHSEKGGGGAVPVPVCLPVCCAAPCVIM